MLLHGPQEPRSRTLYYDCIHGHEHVCTSTSQLVQAGVSEYHSQVVDEM